MMSNTTSNKSDIFAYLIPFVVLLYTFSLIWGWFPLSHTIYVLFLGVLVCIVECNRYVKSKAFVALVILEIVLGLKMFMNAPLHASTNGYIYEMLSICITAMMGYFLLRSKDEMLVKGMVYMIMIIIIVNAIGSSVVETILPGSIRACVTEFHTTGSHELAMKFYKFGMASYELTHAIPTIIPILVFGIKTVHNYRLKLLFISVLAACLILCFLGGSTTVLSLGVLGLIISMLTRPQKGKGKLIIFALFSFVFLLIMNNDALVLSLLERIDDLIGNEGPFHSKILDIEDSVMYDETSEGVRGRQVLYTMSIDAIISNPFFGTNSDIIGHHSTLLDHWACLGLVGFIPYVVFIYKHIKESSHLLSENSRYFYIEGAVLAILMLSVKSIDGWESWLFLFVVLPLFARYIDSISHVDSNNSKTIKR